MSAQASVPTGFVHSPSSRRHDTGPGHPERPERIAALEARLVSAGLWSALDVVEARAASTEELGRVHSAGHVARVEAAIARGVRVVDEGDTRVSAGSWSAALASAGGALDAVDRVVRGAWSNAFVATRPPGHHAERDLPMGFCLLNNVAVAAAHLRAVHGLERVAILDWDVHHGNGTQHLFERDPAVFYASLHQSPLYPGTGAAHERGVGDGLGTTLNVPLPAGADGRAWLGALEARVLPALEAFAPDFVLVSAGYDAHRDDPLAQTELATGDYARMTALVLDLARRACAGRAVLLLEGGYDLAALAASVEASVAELVSAPRTDG